MPIFCYFSIDHIRRLQLKLFGTPNELAEQFRLALLKFSSETIATQLTLSRLNDFISIDVG